MKKKNKGANCALGDGGQWTALTKCYEKSLTLTLSARRGNSTQNPMKNHS